LEPSLERLAPGDSPLELQFHGGIRCAGFHPQPAAASRWLPGQDPLNRKPDREDQPHTLSLTSTHGRKLFVTVTGGQLKIRDIFRKPEASDLRV
jgi:hypothetical protein